MSPVQKATYKCCKVHFVIEYGRTFILFIDTKLREQNTVFTLTSYEPLEFKKLNSKPNVAPDFTPSTL
jgi:hypothetical protein